MDSKGRGALHVRFDNEFAEAIVMLLDQHKEDHDDMKRRLDGMKVSDVWCRRNGSSGLTLDATCSARASSMSTASRWHRLSMIAS